MAGGWTASGLRARPPSTAPAWGREREGERKTVRYGRLREHEERETEINQPKALPCLYQVPWYFGILQVFCILVLRTYGSGQASKIQYGNEYMLVLWRCSYRLLEPQSRCIWGQITHISSSLPPKRDCGFKDPLLSVWC